MSEVAAVIPSWNTAAYIERCLTSLDTQTGVSIETMVIDNGSSDASLALLRRLDIRHVALPKNIGFAAAVNMGAEKTSAPLVLVLNADCFLAPDCLRRLVAEVSTAALRLPQVSRCMLYTEATNPVSNAIYRQIGYAAVEEHADIRFAWAA